MNKPILKSEFDLAGDIVNVLLDERYYEKPVLLLLSGGSTIPIAKDILHRVSRAAHRPVLHIGLIDERYGPVDHHDSNWRQLQLADVPTEMRRHPLLQGIGSSQETARHYTDEISQLLNSVALSCGIFGIGTDGHTAGILPHSSAVRSDQLYTAYTGPDFERITITPTGIQQLDAVFTYATGPQKWPVIKDMLSPGSVAAVPARIFQDITSAVLYTDYKGASE